MARRLGVSPPAVTQACRPGGRLHAACEGKSVNVLHEAAASWQAQRDAAPRPSTPAAPLPPVPAVKVDDDPHEAPARPKSELELELGARGLTDLEDLREPLTTLTERYGDAREFERWVRCRKMLEESRKAEMLRERIAGRLIARTTVVRMLDHVDIAFRDLVSNGSRAIAIRLGLPDQTAATALIRDIMQQSLRSARAQMSTSLASDDAMAPLLEAAE